MARVNVRATGMGDPEPHTRQVPSRTSERRARATPSRVTQDFTRPQKGYRAGTSSTASAWTLPLAPSVAITTTQASPLPSVTRPTDP
jgi:hypothetical protein